MSSSSKIWIFACGEENWKIAREKKIWAVKDINVRDKLTKGDYIILYNRDSKAFVSIFRITGDWRQVSDLTWADEKAKGSLIYPYQVDLEILKEGTVPISTILPKLNFIEIKDKWGVYFRDSPANFKRAIPESDFKIISEAMIEIPFVEDSKPKEPIEPQVTSEKEPTHDEIKEMLYEIGSFEGKIVEMEYPIENLRLDVVWKKISTGNPKWVFEVQMAGNFYEALTKLKHAWDLWNSKPCLVTTDKYVKQAEKLLSGSFHEMSADARIINYLKIVRLHDLLKNANQIKSEVGLE